MVLGAGQANRSSVGREGTQDPGEKGLTGEVRVRGRGQVL